MEPSTCELMFLDFENIGDEWITTMFDLFIPERVVNLSSSFSYSFSLCRLVHPIFIAIINPNTYYS
ncbi:hypothetical protein DFA_03268 [Cavenderia fasciculata]|uniref:Uncharacterized protein n=1 Tax=Cavenderia fasciculata TaxID=261658 RepID=F4PH38_CACFS|nr:uncharacterized protein DFA_03268 [Cavenderia fasciculata]EGG25022.1 hypothetical protein DFA_03268 [Cavenderia fasciculata]|eukprot:XP_004362873.1 hypothetical protein DFA_03268 [Cavenderia fasciculata]